jgi:NADH:ubiquinone reductase (H+-translocating)
MGNRFPHVVIVGGDFGDAKKKCVFVDGADRLGVTIPYDFLVLAMGTHSYFGYDEFAAHAPGLKTLADAGPTGVEMASAIAVLVRNTLKSEFRRIDRASARTVLFDAGPRVLGTFSERLSAVARKRPESLRVEVRLGQAVDQIDTDGVIVGGKRIYGKTVIWAAGVAPSPAGKWLGVATDRAGRVRVKGDLSAPGYPEIFVIGDTASLEQDGHPLPGVAQVAIQQGRYTGRLIHRRVAGRSAPPSFHYFDKGNMAVVGKDFAVLVNHHSSNPIKLRSEGSPVVTAASK